MVDIVTLPISPLARKATARLVTVSNDLGGPLGGPTQRILRLGSRFAVTFDYPPMTPANAQVLVNRLVRAEASPVAAQFPLRGYANPWPGALVVDGAQAAAGGLLPVRGGAPGFVLQEGRPFHLASAGRRWVHLVEQDTPLDATGAATLPLSPLLRVQPADGDALEFVAPLIEGFVTASGVAWDVELATVDGVKFTVTEDR